MATEQSLQLSDISVDDLFRDHSIHYVRSLHNEYRANVENAKAELHSLVGQKYRDLIRIAEDIDGMSSVSERIKQEITSLSYSPSKHVTFGQNNHSRFDSIVRSRKAANARLHSHNTILNNIINNKLVDFDLKIKNGSVTSSPLLIQMALVYHTVSFVFANILETNSSYKANLATLKRNYIEFLETRLGAITMSDASGDFLRENIRASSGSDWVESDDVEFLADSYEEEPGDEDFYSQQTIGFKTHHHSSNPIFNYLVAYIIMSSGDPSLQSMDSIAQRFIFRRTSYIKEQIALKILSDPSTAGNICFSSVFNFIQSTKTYLDEFFFSGDSSDVITFLRSMSKWKATTFIGFHNWFTTEEVTFDVDKYTDSMSSFDWTKSLGDFEVILKECYEDVLRMEVSDDKVSLCKRAERLLYNFVCSARKSEVIAEWSGSSSVTTMLCQGSNLARNLFQLTLSFVAKIIADHQSSLSEVFFSEHPSMQSRNKLFSQEFVDLIEDDVTEYYQRILEASSFNDMSVDFSRNLNAASRLKHWFNVANELLKVGMDPSSFFIEKIVTLLEKSYRNAARFESWGEFNNEVMQSMLLEARTELVSSLLSYVEECITTVTSNIDQAIVCNDKIDLPLWLHFSSILAFNLENITGSDYLKSILDVNIKKIYSRIFEDLSSYKIFESVILDVMFQAQTLQPGFESATLPVRPHLIVYSAMQKLSGSLLCFPRYSQDELLDIYSSSPAKAEFVRTKNEWITKSVIEGGLAKLSKSLAGGDLQQKEDNELTLNSEEIAEGENHAEVTRESTAAETHIRKLSIEQSRQLFANIVFLVCLTTDGEVNSSNSLLAEPIRQINELSEEAIEGSALNIISRGVNKNYLSSKDIYIPLSLN